MCCYSNYFLEVAIGSEYQQRVLNNNFALEPQEDFYELDI
jgi:hypothetical protein